MNKFCRFLIIIFNFILLPIGLLIGIVRLAKYCVTNGLHEYDNSFIELLKDFIHGIKIGFYNNVRFWKTGDIDEFDNIL